ncbi:MAG: AAA family ATPase [Acidobacteriaceae bacterium]
MTQNRPDGLQVALLTVHLEAEAAELIHKSAARMAWALVYVNYDNYFSTAKLPALTQRAIEAQGCVAVVDFDKDPELAIATAECLRHSFYHKIAIFALSSTTDPDRLLGAMRAGYSEFLGKPFNSDEFIDALTRLDYRWTANVGRPANSGQILSFFGAKGGVGTTTLAVHLAMYLVRGQGKKVLLIDNHAQLGHVVLYLGMDGSNHHFYDLVRNVSRLDQELLRGFIATHSSGLDVLSSPDVYGGSWKTDADSVERTLEFLSTQYDFVLLDCEASFEDINLAVVAYSNRIYLVATPEIGAIRDLSRYVDGLIQNEQATKKLQVIINRFSSHEAVTLEQIERAIHLPIALKISNNYGELVRSINVGEPLALDSKSDFSAQMTKWATSLVKPATPAAAEPAKKKFALW